MEDHEIAARQPADWFPITEPHLIALFGKLLEELGELASASSRCLIQGLDEREPKTGKINRAWLEDEIADVTALTALVAAFVMLNTDRIGQRTKAKTEFLSHWLVALYSNAGSE